MPILSNVLGVELIGNRYLLFQHRLKNGDLKFLKERLPNVIVIAMDQNNLDDIDEFQHLNDLPDLEQIEISGNPVC